MIAEDFVPSIEAVLQGYKQGEFTPRELITHLSNKADAHEDRCIWIKRFSSEDLEPYLARLESVSPVDLPLYGVPFAVKDNIDIAGQPTTAACPEFSFLPEENAFVVQQLLDAGAIPVGKTNMDQFATGLVGTRSPKPWGPCHNAFDSDVISGGSSSGSAVAVSQGLVSFSLGTDTAGSGRVPAMLNNLYGLKPSRGVFSMSGVLPACRTLDCPSVFTLCVNDAATLFSIMARKDCNDSYARSNPFSNSRRLFGEPADLPVIGVPKASQLEFFGSDSAETQFSKALADWESLGAKIVEMDFEPLFQAARLLYEGPWVAERYAVLESILNSQPNAVHEVVRGIVESASEKDAVAAFKAEYELQQYRVYADQLFEDADFLLTPTAPRSYLISELLENPVELNSNMGYYTNYMNLLDLCGLAVPAGFMSNGIPFGVTMVAPRFREMSLLNQALIWERKQQLPMGASAAIYSATTEYSKVSTRQTVEVAVCGAHLSGMPLNWQLTERGATLVNETRTSEHYRFYALRGGPVKRPGLVRVEHKGSSILVEVWSMPASEFGSFVAAIPYPLGIGKLELEDGKWVSGFICEGIGIEGAEDITELESWRIYINQTAR